ncbi:serine hydrolase domain-containing protein [Paraurantiacibacter namhicola]|uniref:Penicillin-binding protein 4 n=1 Tax=Paraurantiacibacter namhicola TaxID=645517 RepID=A0A1C7D6Q3_9SPHN|nr:serine hydrolase domain-containing protein [Paraurantiacibacter namhicola]ANU06983.1 Penicillin-binding protein 4* [Paraurantiacibacter namhicola]
MKIALAITAIVAAACSPLAAKPFASATLLPGGTVESEVHGDYGKAALFEAGSISKFACTLAALRLDERGVLDIDQPLGQLLPRTADTPIADIPFRHVLASRSGIADGLMPAFQSDPQSVMATPDAITAVLRYASGEPAAEAGTKWSYDLVNWIVVQAVIEQATRRPVADVIASEVIAPAGMTQSRMFIGTIGAGAQEPVSSGIPIPGFLTCAGGLATTPQDLIALARFPHKGGLGAASLQALTTVTTPDEGYTLGGRYADPDGDGKAWVSWQSGSNGAYKSLVVYDPASDTGFAAMTASDDEGVIHAARADWLNAR